MSQNTTNKYLLSEEDLAIQDTLVMTAEERLDLLAHLMIDKIIEDEKLDKALYAKIMGKTI
ncbi:MAG: hypothetical protein QG562_463 [Patescibacteria group bacterium]|nr:hypothetical protein [Patescibacteria group bacterium]